MDFETSEEGVGVRLPPPPLPLCPSPLSLSTSRPRFRCNRRLFDRPHCLPKTRSKRVMVVEAETPLLYSFSLRTLRPLFFAAGQPQKLHPPQKKKSEKENFRTFQSGGNLGDGVGGSGTSSRGKGKRHDIKLFSFSTVALRPVYVRNRSILEKQRRYLLCVVPLYTSTNSFSAYSGSFRSIIFSLSQKRGKSQECLIEFVAEGGGRPRNGHEGREHFINVSMSGV